MTALHIKNFNNGRYMQTFQPDNFIPAIVKGTIDCYQFIPLSVTYTLAGGHKVSTKQNIFSHTFQLMSMWFDMVLL